MNFNFIKKNSLFLFLFCSFLILGILISSNYFSTKNLKNDVLTNFGEHRNILLENSITNIEKYLNEKQTETQLLKEKIIQNKIPINFYINSIFSNKKNNLTKLNNFFIVNGNGKIIFYSNPKYFDYLNLNIADTLYFKNTIKSNKITIKYITTSNPGQIYILAPILSDNLTILAIIRIQKLYSKFLKELIENNNYFFIYDKTTNITIMKSSNLDKNSLDSYIKKKYNKTKILSLNSKNFFFNKRQFNIGNDIFEIGVFSSTSKIDNMFSSLNQKHLILIVFIFSILIFIFFTILNLNSKKKIMEYNLKKAKDILNNYGIKFDIETNKSNFTTNKILLEGNIYMLRDNKIKSNELFVKSLSNRKIGLGFIRENISEFKKKYNLENTSFIKLDTRKDNSKYKNTFKIEDISTIILEFLSNSNNPKIIYIDSLDYIILKNSFKKVLIEFYDIKEKIRNSNNILLFSINQNIITNRELLALENEFLDINFEEKKILKNISKLELNILIYINELTCNKIHVRYKDISLKFNITKPTTRKKISQLEKMNLILIKNVGRNKLLELTKNGKNII